MRQQRRRRVDRLSTAPARLGLYCLLLLLVLIVCEIGANRYGDLEDSMVQTRTQLLQLDAPDEALLPPLRAVVQDDADAGTLAETVRGIFGFRMGRIAAGYAVASAGIARGELSLADRGAIGRAVGAAQAAQAPLVGEMQLAFMEDPRLHAALSRPWLEVTYDSSQLIARLSALTATDQPIDARSAADVAGWHARVAAAASRFKYALSSETRRLLNARLLRLRGQRLLISLGVGTGIAASLVLVLAIVAGVATRRRREVTRTHGEAAALYTELARQRAERALLSNQAQFRAVFERSPIGIALLGDDGSTLESNAALSAITGEPTARLVHSSDPEFAALVEGRVPTYRCERRWAGNDGGSLATELTISSVDRRYANGVAAIAMVQDVTERNAAGESLRHAAMHDAMTALPNRPRFMRALEEALTEDAGAGRYAVLFIDLDAFKLVNDSRGHHAGDKVIRATAGRLAAMMREGDVAARFHGDEFALLLRDVDDPRIAAAFGERVQHSLREAIELDGDPAFVTPSIGIVLGGRRYRSADAIVRDADAAMRHAKARGGSQTVFFDDSIHERLAERLRIASDMRGGIERGEFRLAYQPIVDLTDGQVYGFETLLRWNHPERGEISPEEFIPIAEDSNAIVELGRFALEHACQTLADLQREAPRRVPLNLSVNLSAVQLTHGTLVEEVREALARSGLAGERLCLEITESALIDNSQSAAGVLRQLKALGTRLAIDDFGTGYSSLRYVHEFPIDVLKIERSFVGGEGEGLANEPIVTMLLTLAESLGLDVIAEGVETHAQRRALRRAGCTYGQGFLFGKALERDQIEGWLAANAKPRPRLLAAR